MHFNPLSRANLWPKKFNIRRGKFSYFPNCFQWWFKSLLSHLPLVQVCTTIKRQRFQPFFSVSTRVILFKETPNSSVHSAPTESENSLFAWQKGANACYAFWLISENFWRNLCQCSNLYISRSRTQIGVKFKVKAKTVCKVVNDDVLERCPRWS